MITDMDTPLGHNIGNSLEVMESMDVLKAWPRRPDRGLPAAGGEHAGAGR